MKKTFLIKRAISHAIASAFLVSSVLAPSVQAQQPRVPINPNVVPKGPIDPNKKPLPALPPTIKSPSNNAHVKTPVVVQGTAEKGSKVQVTVKPKWEQTVNGKTRHFVGKAVSATASVDSSYKWSTTPIKLEAPKEAKQVNYEISAIQIYADGRKSAAAVIVVKPAFILAPLRPTVDATMAQILRITSHKDGDKISRNSTSLLLKGTATGKFVHVQLTMHAYTPKGGFFDGYRAGTVRQIHRNAEATVKNGAWSVPLNVKVSDKKVNKVTYEFIVSMRDDKGKIVGSTQEIKLTSK